MLDGLQPFHQISAFTLVSAVLSWPIEKMAKAKKKQKKQKDTSCKNTKLSI